MEQQTSRTPKTSLKLFTIVLIISTVLIVVIGLMSTSSKDKQTAEQATLAALIYGAGMEDGAGPGI